MIPVSSSLAEGRQAATKKADIHVFHSHEAVAVTRLSYAHEQGACSREPNHGAKRGDLFCGVIKSEGVVGGIMRHGIV